MRLLLKRILLPPITVFLCVSFLNAETNEYSGKSNRYRLEKLTPFIQKHCRIQMLDGKNIYGKVVRLEPQHVILGAENGPFYRGEKQIPIYGIQQIKSEKHEQVFLLNNVKKQSLSLMSSANLSDTNFEELIAVLEAEEIPLLAKPGEVDKPVKSVPQPMKKLTKMKDDFEIIDLINSHATNEDE